MSGREHITEAQARACLSVVQAYIDRTEGPGWEPKAYPPGHEGNFWCISLECGADCWPVAISDTKSVTWPPGVWVEPVNHFALALHPA